MLSWMPLAYLDSGLSTWISGNALWEEGWCGSRGRQGGMEVPEEEERKEGR